MTTCKRHACQQPFLLTVQRRRHANQPARQPESDTPFRSEARRAVVKRKIDIGRVVSRRVDSRAKRELVAEKSSTKFLSSGKEQVYTYDIIIRNNKKEAAKLTLKDQYPISTDKEIEVELLQSDGAKAETETGILTWELNLKPAETKKVRISYRVKAPKSKAVYNL